MGVDSTEGKVYLLPAKGSIQPDDEIIAPALYRLIHIKGDEAGNRLVRHIQFRGIEFRYTDRMPEDVWPEEWIKRQAELPDAMIVVEDAEHVAITDCHFLWSGSYAVDLEKYAQNIEVTAQRNRPHGVRWRSPAGVRTRAEGCEQEQHRSLATLFITPAKEGTSIPPQ